MRYLDPKIDLTFWNVFGRQPVLMISFLNAFLPLSPDRKIIKIEYLTIGDGITFLKKWNVSHVRCTDCSGKQFIVEIQILWHLIFTQYIVFDSSKAYVRQLDSKEEYELLQPVYSLSLVNQVYLPDVEDYYHLYSIVCDKHTDKVIQGLQFIFIELPKFTPQTITEKKMAALWLRYLTEINEHTRQAPAELLANPEVHKALATIEESAYTDAQLLGYDKFWDIIRTESMYYNDALKEGLEKGMAKGLAKGLAKGRKLEKLENATNLKKLGVSVDDICRALGLSKEEVEAL